MRPTREESEEIVQGSDGVGEGHEMVPVEVREITPVPIQVFIETGRGNAIPVSVGDSFPDTIERVAEQSNYGGYFRVFLNGAEIVEPTTAPRIIEEGQRISITAYDKVGV